MVARLWVGLLVWASFVPMAAAQQPPAPPEGPSVLPLPPIEPIPAAPVDEGEQRRIRSLIDELASIDSPMFGMSSTLSGSAFAPLPEMTSFGTGLISVNHGLKPSGAFTELVKLGPKAMPFLLDALGDARPTRLVIRHNGMVGMMWHQVPRLEGNPANAREAAAAADVPFGETPRDPRDPPLTAYTVTVGDVCLVAVGQITGRGYAAVSYVPSLNIVISSPITSPVIATTVRRVWSDQNPSQRLFQDLVLDLFTRGSVGFAPPAATRLLYYFPDRSGAIIAKLLDDLDVKQDEDWLRRELANGVSACDLIDAVTWSSQEEVRAALLRLMDRTDDPDLFVRCMPAAGQDRHARVTARLLDLLKALPDTDASPHSWKRFALLVALAQHDPEAARPVVESHIAGSIDRTVLTCHAMGRVRPSWTCEALLPLLKDRRDIAGLTHGVLPGKDAPRLPIRVCDCAAQAMTASRPELGFVMIGTREELDRREDEILRTLEAERAPASTPPREP